MKVAALVLAALLATPAPSYAVETFNFSGAWVTGDNHSPWIGSVSFDVNGDGTFENVGWSLTSNHIDDGGPPFAVDTLTIENGQIVVLDFRFPTQFNMDARGVFFHDIEPTVGVTQAFAPWDVASPAPEPETWMLLLAGAGVIGLARRKTGRRQAGAIRARLRHSSREWLNGRGEGSELCCASGAASRIFRPLATIAMVFFAQSASADLLQYDFILSVLTPGNPPFNPRVPDGAGFFLVNSSAIPSIGAAVVTASEIEGHIGVTQPPSTVFPFGDTALGMNFGTAVPNAIFLNGVDGPCTIFGSSPATVTFQDGVPTGISYTAINYCTANRALNGTQISLSGLTFDLSLPANEASGTISILSAVPEPETATLMLLGFAALAYKRRYSALCTG